VSSDSAVEVSESHGYFLCFVTVVCYLILSESNRQNKVLRAIHTIRTSSSW